MILIPQNQNKIILGACVAFVVAVFVIPCQVFAFSDDFESYTPANLDGQGDWTKDSGIGVQSASTIKPYSGSLGWYTSSAGSSNYYLNQPLNNSAIISFYIWISSSTKLALEADIAATWLFQMTFDADYSSWDWIYNDGYGHPFTIIPGNNINQWYKVDIQIDYLSGYADFRLDNGPWFTWPLWQTEDKITKFRFNATPSGGVVAIDDLSTTDEGLGRVSVVGDDYTISVPSAMFPSPYFCDSNYMTCDYDFSYSLAAIGCDVYLFEYTAGNPVPGDEIASTTLAEQYPLYETFVLDYNLNFQDRYFFLLACADPSTLKTYGPVSVFWSADVADDTCTYICDDIATTTNTFFYGVECGMRKIACWLAVPAPDSKNKFILNLAQLSSSFPFSLYRNMSDTFKSIQSIATTSIDIPIMNYDGSTLGTIQTGRISEVEDGGLFALIYDIMEKSMYFLLVIYVIWRLIRLKK